ncbi:phospholipid transfer protein C2CD2L isoform X1 [Diorhabda carinulata]|uniref:phospholipid transfer protein C2CD2L isoform X1 n=1 Tax=Diorhabda carinulata TaxID=1163345 RepID=UPI0025A2D77D|nr:phospholipid transfer protein C2CD2L isoform X1 [Diorhabda carinulata]
MDLAEVVEDLICTFDGSGDTTMDTLAMFVFGWILAALFILWLGKLLYEKFQNRNKTQSEAKAKLLDTQAKTTDSIDGDNKGIKKTSISSVSKGYVAPTPPVRKRLTRQSPAPESRKPRFIPAPQCTGPDNVCVLWVNDVFQWLYNDFVIVNELLGVWIAALNEYTKKSGAEQGIGVEIVRILPETHPPVLSNIFAEADSKDDVTITCDCECTPALQLKSFRQKGEKNETSHYRVNVNRFRARLNIFCVSEKLRANVKCDGWPEIKIALAPVGNIKNNLDESQLQEVIIEILTDALRNTEVDLNLSQYPTCPRLVRHVALPGQILPVHYDSMGTGNISPSYTSTPNHLAAGARQIPGEKRLLVKVVRAAQLGATQGCAEPYCVVEMDEPPQKNQTAVAKNTDSPQWDEHFLFDLSPSTAELLFEIYDHAVKPNRFLGLGIVGVEELLVNPSQRQIISLQSRPYESDPVSGTLTVEFLFIEGADIPNISGGQPYKIKETIRTPSPTTNKISLIGSTTSTFQNDSITNGNHSPQTGYRDLDRSKINTNTLVIHSMQRQPSQRLVKVELNNGAWKEIETIEVNPEDKEIIAVEENQETNGKLPTERNGTTNGESKDVMSDSAASKPGEYSYTGPSPVQNESQSFEYRGRPRKRRDFFGTIKRRLGKSMNRSKSAGPENDIGRDDSLNRSVSADRGRHDESYRLNVPGQRSMDETSRRSSLSEASGMSSASTRTYINEASTLVLETIENGIKKHYLVPLSLAQKSKWRKKGTKLHIYNDHTFVAKHLQGGTVCQVCGKNIARRFGKQGYECRDCLIKCHKHCHVKVNDSCPTSTIHSVELSYITNPLTDKNFSFF